MTKRKYKIVLNGRDNVGTPNIFSGLARKVSDLREELLECSKPDEKGKYPCTMDEFKRKQKLFKNMCKQLLQMKVDDTIFPVIFQDPNKPTVECLKEWALWKLRR